MDTYVYRDVNVIKCGSSFRREGHGGTYGLRRVKSRTWRLDIIRSYKRLYRFTQNIVNVVISLSARNVSTTVRTRRLLVYVGRRVG